MELEQTLKRNEDLLYGLLGAGVFGAQLTAKDIQYAQSSGYWATLNSNQQVQLVANSVLGRTLGITPFPAVSKYPQTINPSGVINGFSIGGAAVWLIGKVFDGSTHAKMAQKVGATVAVAGAIGGFFDDPIYTGGFVNNSGQTRVQTQGLAPLQTTGNVPFTKGNGTMNANSNQGLL